MFNLLANIQIIPILVAIAVMFFVAVVFGYLIMVFSKKFVVETDEREEKISGCLAGANCGACGHAGCGGFAKALMEGSGKIDDCAVTVKDQKLIIAQILGIKYEGGSESKVIVNCVGGNSAVDKNQFVGNRDCVFQNMIAGGKKQCPTACLGDGTCNSKCKIGAIKVVDGVAVIDQTLCIKCGACITACPKKIIRKTPKSAKIYIACSSQCKGKTVSDACPKGCIACGICIKTCESGAITMVDNLPIIDYTKCTACKKCLEKCPKKIIREI